jgi:predicted nucleic acid-binding protein
LILYVDSSALVKRYVMEPGSKELVSLLGEASLVGTASITRAEIAAALARAGRRSRLTPEDATKLLASFRRDWPAYFAIHITDTVVRNADYLAVQYALRGYDAVQLSCALAWREEMGGAQTIFATFDNALWDASQNEGFAAFPRLQPSVFVENQPGVLPGPPTTRTKKRSDDGRRRGR